MTRSKTARAAMRLPTMQKTAALALLTAAATSGAVGAGSVPGSFSASGTLILPGAKLQKLSGAFTFAEGPASNARGDVFFTDQPNDRIMEWSAAGKLSVFMHPSGRSNGLCFDRRGSLWACADAKNELWRISPAGKVSVMVKDYRGKLLNGPNDIWIRPDGGLYLTDPYYKRPYWKRGPIEQAGEEVFFLPANHKALRPVITNMKRPNGIIGTPDGKTLYVSDIGAGKTFRYHVQPDGSLTDGTLFCSMGSDGMTMDNAGDVYLTGNGVTVFDRSGKQIAHIAVPEAWTGNVCFGGADRHTLFITASRGLYAIRTRTRGVGSQ